MLKSVIIGLSLILLFVAPTSASACGRPVATMASLDSGHPVAPCVNAVSIIDAVASGVASYIVSVDTPQLNGVLPPIIYFVSSFVISLLIPHLFVFAPLTPPPRQFYLG